MRSRRSSDDPSSDAYERLVDRLLDSPHYGERWARHWLDLARFAESHGFEHDYDRSSAYHYRDFVIKALNQDLPYDTFVKWQIAGDEYEPDNPLALMATGYLAAGVHSTQITKNQVEKERYDELDDMLSTIGTSLLGLTIGCARCHDHKFDAIPNDDYYRLLSTFTTAVRSEIDLNLDRERYEVAKAAFDREHSPLAEALARYEAEQLPGKLDAWLAARATNTSAGGSPVGPSSAEKGAAVAQPAVTWQILQVTSAKSEAGATLAPLADGSLLATGKNADSDTYIFLAHTHQTNITGLRLEALADDSLPHHGPGRAENGNFCALWHSRHCGAAWPRGRGHADPIRCGPGDLRASRPACDGHDRRRQKICLGRRRPDWQGPRGRIRVCRAGRVRRGNDAYRHAKVREQQGARDRPPEAGDLDCAGAAAARWHSGAAERRRDRRARGPLRRSADGRSPRGNAPLVPAARHGLARACSAPPASTRPRRRSRP